MYTVDAAHLPYENVDLRLAILEGCLSTGGVLPVGFHLGYNGTRMGRACVSRGERQVSSA